MLKNNPQYGDRAFREVIKFKRSHQGAAVIWQDWYSNKKRRDSREIFLFPSVCAEESP